MPMRKLATTNLGSGRRFSMRKKMGFYSGKSKFAKAVKSIVNAQKETKFSQVKALNTLKTAYRFLTQADAQWAITDIVPDIATGDDEVSRDGSRIYVKAMQMNLMFKSIVAGEPYIVRALIVQAKTAITDIEHLFDPATDADQATIYTNLYNHSTVRAVLMDKIFTLSNITLDSLNNVKLIKKYKKVKHVANYKQDDDTKWDNPYHYYLITVVKRVVNTDADTADAVSMSYDIKWTFKDI